MFPNVQHLLMALFRASQDYKDTFKNNEAQISYAHRQMQLNLESRALQNKEKNNAACHRMEESAAGEQQNVAKQYLLTNDHEASDGESAERDIALPGVVPAPAVIKQTLGNSLDTHTALCVERSAVDDIADQLQATMAAGKNSHAMHAEAHPLCIKPIHHMADVNVPSMPRKRSHKSKVPKPMLRQLGTNNWQILSHRLRYKHSKMPSARTEQGVCKLLLLSAGNDPRLLTIQLPKKSITLHKLLQQLHVAFNSETLIRCLELTDVPNIDLVVSVGYAVANSLVAVVEHAASEYMKNVQQPNMCQDTIRNHICHMAAAGVGDSIAHAATGTLNSLPHAPELAEIDASSHVAQRCEVNSNCANTTLTHSPPNHNAELSVALNCNWIQVGTCKYQPAQTVVFTANVTYVAVPMTDAPGSTTMLHIHTTDVVWAMAYFSQNPMESVLALNVLHAAPSNWPMPQPDTTLDTAVACAYHEHRIVMQFQPASRFECNFLMSLWQPFQLLTRETLLDLYMELMASELHWQHCHQIALPASAKLHTNQQPHKLFVYPAGKGGLTITMDDYMCLAAKQYLNDVIIDFYLKWLHNSIVPPGVRDRVFVFSSFFYKRLTTPDSTQLTNAAQLTPAQCRHALVKNWTKHVRLFEKDFIVIPINENAHWFLAIICFPYLLAPTIYHTTTPVLAYTNDNAPQAACHMAVTTTIKQPLILIFDSFPFAARDHVVQHLRDYLTCEFNAKMPRHAPYVFDATNMPGHVPQVPLQTNHTDCGLYLLQYAEQFFKAPINDYTLPITQLSNWFDALTVTRKREEIASLVQCLANENSHAMQPIIFPTLNLPTCNVALSEAASQQTG